MDKVTDLNASGETLAHDFAKLQKYFLEFEQLKSLILEQFPGNAESAIRLDMLFPGGVSAISSEVERDMKKITSLFKQLETQFQHLDGQVRNS